MIGIVEGPTLQQSMHARNVHVCTALRVYTMQVARAPIHSTLARHAVHVRAQLRVNWASRQRQIHTIRLAQ